MGIWVPHPWGSNFFHRMSVFSQATLDTSHPYPTAALAHAMVLCFTGTLAFSGCPNLGPSLLPPPCGAAEAVPPAQRGLAEDSGLAFVRGLHSQRSQSHAHYPTPPLHPATKHRSPNCREAPVLSGQADREEAGRLPVSGNSGLRNVAQLVECCLALTMAWV